MYKMVDKNNCVVKKFVFNQKKQQIDKQILFKIGEGREGKVYRWNDRIIKIYKNPLSFLLKINNFKKMQQIVTKRILLPDNIVLNDQGLPIGYDSLFIEKKPISLFKQDKEILISELKNLQNDLINLSENHILLRDLSRKNSIVNGRIYIIDPGFYQKIPFSSLEKIEKYNYLIINNYIKNELLTPYVFNRLNKIEQIDKYRYYGEALKKILSSYQNINEAYNDSKKIYTLK